MNKGVGNFKYFFFIFFLAIFLFKPALALAQCPCSINEWDPPEASFCLTYSYICYNEKHDFPQGPYGPYTEGNFRYTVTVKNPCNTEGTIAILYGSEGDEAYINPTSREIATVPANSSRNFYKTITDRAYWWYNNNYGSMGVVVTMPWGSNMAGGIGVIGYYSIPIPQIAQCPTPPTLTPTPVSCSLNSQQIYFSGSGTPLINDYITTQYKGSPQYTLFSVSKSGTINKAEIYGSLDRDIPKGGKVLQCKITNSTGIIDLGESTTNNGPFTKGTSWMKTDFTAPVSVTSGNTYRLYCKVNNVYGGGLIYWLDFWNNRTDKTRKIYSCN